MRKRSKMDKDLKLINSTQRRSLCLESLNHLNPHKSGSNSYLTLKMIESTKWYHPLDMTMDVLTIHWWRGLTFIAHLRNLNGSNNQDLSTHYVTIVLVHWKCRIEGSHFNLCLTFKAVPHLLLWLKRVKLGDQASMNLNHTIKSNHQVS